MASTLSTVLDYAAPAGLAAATIAAANSLAKFADERSVVPTILDWQVRYPEVSKMLGGSAHLKRLQSMSCISPSWSSDFFARLEKVCGIYQRFNAYQCHVRQYMDETLLLGPRMEPVYTAVGALNTAIVRHSNSHTIGPLLDAFSKQYGTEIEACAQWFVSRAENAASMLFHSASLLETMAMETENMLTLLVELRMLMNAFNIYWINFGPMMQTAIERNDEAHTSAEDILTKKFETVETLLANGLGTVLTSGAGGAGTNNAYDLGPTNEIVTSHVRWWTMMHCMFMSTMRPVFEHMEVSILGSSAQCTWSELVQSLSERASRMSPGFVGLDQATIVRITTDGCHSWDDTSTSSSIKNCVVRVAASVKEHGIGAILANPFMDFFPSPHVQSDCYLPTARFERADMTNYVETVAKRLVWMQKVGAETSNTVVTYAQIVDGLCRAILVDPVLAPLARIRSALAAADRNLRLGNLTVSLLNGSAVEIPDGVLLPFHNSPLLFNTRPESRQTLAESVERISNAINVTNC